jgi:uncharacterized protein (TIGR00369 family)
MTDNSQRKQNAELFLSSIRHCDVLGIAYADTSENSLTLMLPYGDKIVGNPFNGVIHSGSITTLMDTAMGLCVPLSLENFELCPTLDLRIDYMGAAIPNETVYGEAVVYRVTEHVVFVRGTAFHEGASERPIARCVASFMRLGKRLKEAEKNKS